MSITQIHTSFKNMSFENIPDELKIPEEKRNLTNISLDGLKQNALQYIPKEKRTEALCVEAVKQNGYALQYIPQELRTREICLAAVKTTGLSDPLEFEIAQAIKLQNQTMGWSYTATQFVLYFVKQNFSEEDAKVYFEKMYDMFGTHVTLEVRSYAWNIIMESFPKKE